MYDSNFGATLLPLRMVLDKKRSYSVPAYQRRYQWKKERVEQLWDDLVETYRVHGHKNVERLLGSIVVVEKHGRANDVVDGQQRLISLTLMYCAIRDSLKHQGDGDDDLQSELKDFVQDVEKRVINDKNTFITLNNNDDEQLFLKIIRGEYASRRTRSPRASKQIRNNYNRLRDLADKLCTDLDLKNKKTGREKMGEIIEAMTDNVCVITVSVKNENDALQTFQALNTSGQPLTSSDIIKSHLIQQSTGLEQSWTAAFAQYDNEINKNPNKADALVYESMLSRNPTDKDMAMRDLHDKVKEQVKDRNTAKEFVENLRTDLDIIRILDDPSTTNGSPLSHILYGLKQVNAVYFRRPIIAAVREWGINDGRIPLLTSCLLKFFFMYRTVCKMDIDQLRNLSRNLTYEIIHNPNSNIGNMCKIILDTVKRDDGDGNASLNVFHDRFASDFLAQKYSRAVVKYIFISIERELQNEFEVPTRGFDVEHIFPEVADKDTWPNSEELSQFRNNVGNLTLLPPKWNKVLQNYSFHTKKTGKREDGTMITQKGKKGSDASMSDDVVSYERSRLELNRYFRNIDAWDRNAILERQKVLLEHAKKIWNLSGYDSL